METTKKEPTPEALVLAESIKQENQIVKFNPEEDIKQGQKAAKALMKVVEITKPLKLNGKTYLYFEHWQTMAKFFRMTVGTEWVKKLENGYEAKAVVYQNGVVVGGAEASCTSDEANWNTQPHQNQWGKTVPGKPEFQLKSMAQTRAMSKALRSILGYIPVLAGIEATPAEEMDNMPLKPQTPPTTQNYASQTPPHKAIPDEPDINELVPGNPPINLVGKDYERFAERISKSQNLKELEAWGSNIKFLGKTLTTEEKKKLRVVFKLRKEELSNQDIIIEDGDLPQ